MLEKKLRVRFAPAPTGMMHLGNIRTALMNYLIAQQKDGTFVLRIEDTDPERNFDSGAKKIQEDLAWLSLKFDEGPQIGGPHTPYFQSERDHLYKETLQKFIDKELAYRCFCSSEELDKKRQRQIALKKPPRYDKTCTKITVEDSQKLAETKPFIWRMKLNPHKSITINDLSHGTVTFHLKNFSDFPITRQNGSVTFMFANFVDDTAMNINCVIRGEDHLSNTAGQAALYDALNIELPTFWHMPILCNIDGKKLSKRDFGFSLRDLQASGFLPEAIVNYLAIIGGSFKDEIMSLETLTQKLNFDKPSTTGQIKYDVEKLRWVNHKWICKLPTEQITQLSRPYLENIYPEIKNINNTDLANLVGHIQTEMITLEDAPKLLAFYFEEPQYENNIARALTTPEQRTTVVEAIKKQLPLVDAQNFTNTLKTAAKESGCGLKPFFSVIRYALMGKPHGPGIAELIQMIGTQKAQQRIENLLKIIN